MQNNILQIKTQIPMENTYHTVGSNLSSDLKLNEFLLNHFDFPDDNFDEILNFISGDEEMVRMIFDVPDIFLREGLTSKPMLNFMGYCDPGEVILEIQIFSQFDIDKTIEIDDSVLNFCIHNYNVRNDYVLMVVK